LDAIEKNNYDIFSTRAHINSWGKINRAVGILIKGEGK